MRILLSNSRELFRGILVPSGKVIHQAEIGASLYQRRIDLKHRSKFRNRVIELLFFSSSLPCTEMLYDPRVILRASAQNSTGNEH